jgi:prepilin-type N-terminal cleavage/methylation domain-containing protein
MRSVACGNERGFTLLEALTASAIFAFVLVGAASLFATNNSAYNAGQSKAEVQQNARVALESAAREIRMAGYDHSGVIAGSLTNHTSIQTGNATSLTLVADVTNDNVLDQVTYRLSGTQLVRDISSWNGTSFPAATTGVIADCVSSLTFAYFTSTDATIATPVASGSLDSIKRITISLTTTQASVDQQRSYPLVVDMRLRN